MLILTVLGMQNNGGGGPPPRDHSPLPPLIKAHNCSSFGRIFSGQLLVGIFLLYSKET